MERSFISKWIQAIRPFAYPTTFTAAIVGALYALLISRKNFSIKEWSLWLLLTIVAFLFHTAGNLISEYFDFKHGVDREDTFGSSNVLVGKILTPKSVLNAGLGMLIIGAILGFIVYILKNYDYKILILGGIGFLGALFYTGWPFNYKYYGLGDLGIFIVFGPALTSASFLVLYGDLIKEIFYLGTVVGMLVVSVLHANNFRDINQDRRAGIKTFAMLLGEKGSKIYYAFLVFGAYIIIITLSILKIVPIYSLLIILTFPIAIKNQKKINSQIGGSGEKISMMDMFSAQHLLGFGILLSISLIIGRFFH
ncbi:1,4-dihydroxy-2-naphthoate octaprenyltransferase [bacterium]|nr:1,4-dihydroxy-2-naphthoate octaprenyltransferase [bacterium]